MMSGKRLKALVIQRLPMTIFDCNTILCVQNQMPEVGMDDLFIIGFLVVAVVVVVYLMIEAWKEN